MPPQVKLSAILEGLEMQGDEIHVLFDRRKGEVLALSDEELRAADNDDDLSDYPDWQRESIEQAKAVEADQTGRFAPLPDRFEIDEWAMMQDFASSREDEELSERLLQAIHGRGAFRYFKDLVYEAGIANDWYEFRNGRYREIALDWCRDNGIEVDPDA